MPVHRITMREQMEMNTGTSPNVNGMINEIKDFNEIDGIKLPTSNKNIFLNASAAVNNIMRRQLCHMVN